MFYVPRLQDHRTKDVTQVDLAQALGSNDLNAFGSKVPTCDLKYMLSNVGDFEQSDCCQCSHHVALSILDTSEPIHVY